VLQSVPNGRSPTRRDRVLQRAVSKEYTANVKLQESSLLDVTSTTLSLAHGATIPKLQTCTWRAEAEVAAY
jgi:hypothetical protein